MKPAIRVENVSKRYAIGRGPRGPYRTLRESLADAALAPFRWIGGKRELEPEPFWALRDVSFEVQPGEVVGIIGRNGAGKSTLLKILSRIVDPTAGRIEVRGRMGSLLEVGTGFHPELTGRENIYLNGSILGMTRREIDRKFDEIVAFSEIEQFLDTPVKRYSSGMYVRLAFAVAAHLDLDVLVIDEVLAVGDVGFQKKCMGRMASVAREGRTILFVSHNFGAVRSLCSRAAWIAAGQVQLDGRVNAVADAYLKDSVESQRMVRRGPVHGDKGRGEDYLLHTGESGNRLAVNCGEPLGLSFVLEAPRVLQEVSVGLTILSGTDEVVVSMASKVQNVTSEPGASRWWRVEADLACLPLNAGDYTVRVYIGDGIRDVARFSDAFSIEIREYDVFGWGNKLPAPEHWGKVYWAPAWKITPQDTDDATLQPILTSNSDSTGEHHATSRGEDRG